MADARSTTGLSQLSTARSSASMAKRGHRGGKKTRRKKSGEHDEFASLRENLASGRKMNIKGKGGNFKTHTSRGNAGDAGGKRGVQLRCEACCVSCGGSMAVLLDSRAATATAVSVAAGGARGKLGENAAVKITFVWC